MNFELYLSHLILRELEQFRDSAAMPAATEVAQHDGPPLPFATGQDPTPAEMADSHCDTDGEDENQRATARQPRDITDLVDADEAANGFQGTPVRLMTLRNATALQRRSNGARQQRIYRLAHKVGVTPGAPRWVRNGRPHAQPAVPRSVVRADGTAEYNQFMYDSDSGRVVLRMPGGWRRDLVRDRRGFLGVVVVDGFLWPRFDRGLPRRVTADWGKLPASFVFSCLVGADCVCL